MVSRVRTESDSINHNRSGSIFDLCRGSTFHDLQTLILVELDATARKRAEWPEQMSFCKFYIRHMGTIKTLKRPLSWTSKIWSLPLSWGTTHTLRVLECHISLISAISLGIGNFLVDIQYLSLYGSNFTKSNESLTTVAPHLDVLRLSIEYKGIVDWKFLATQFPHVKRLYVTVTSNYSRLLGADSLHDYRLLSVIKSLSFLSVYTRAPMGRGRLSVTHVRRNHLTGKVMSIHSQDIPASDWSYALHSDPLYDI